MQIYLVGGAVRDKLLGRKVVDNDYVVVGATPHEMLAQGFTQVGKDFPVFLHPQTKEEYALARTERKSGQGYKGFICDFSPDITLQQDLARRDLTINAMALSEDGLLIDPFGGQRDLSERRLKHVSPAFVEDPLRVFRVARFAARFHEEGFAIDQQTFQLMQTIADSGELKSLHANRVWQESARALMENNPAQFFITLKSANALRDWFIELDRLWGIPNPALWHPEIDTGVHTMMVLQQAKALSNELAVRFAALVHDFGKALTDTTAWPSHHDHDELGKAAIEQLCSRLNVPNECKELALLCSEHHSLVHRLGQKTASEVLAMLDACDAWRRPERFWAMLTVCKADFLGRKHFASKDYPQMQYLQDIYTQCREVDAQIFIAQGLQGAAIKDAINQTRLSIIDTYLDAIR